jgi:hypothetical protein
LNKKNIRKILINAIKVTEPTWTNFDEDWSNLEIVFLSRAYNRMDFDGNAFFKLLKEYHINSIRKLGVILDNVDFEKGYNRKFAGSLESKFYQDMKKCKYGKEGKSFYNLVEKFIEVLGTSFRSLWWILTTTNYLKNHYKGDFGYFLMSRYCQFKDMESISYE